MRKVEGWGRVRREERAFVQYGSFFLYMMFHCKPCSWLMKMRSHSNHAEIREEKLSCKWFFIQIWAITFQNYFGPHTYRLFAVACCCLFTSFELILTWNIYGWEGFHPIRLEALPTSWNQTSELDLVPPDGTALK